MALAFFGWLTLEMLSKTGEQNETTWTRLLYLYHGIESLAFAAAGFIFGREVQRQRVRDAEVRATEATQQAEHAEEQAVDAKQEAAAVTARGEALAESIRAEQERALRAAASDPAPESRSGGPAASTDLGRLVAIADRFFPHRDER